jgi:hypothetical protein
MNHLFVFLIGSFLTFRGIFCSDSSAEDSYEISRNVRQRTEDNTILILTSSLQFSSGFVNFDPDMNDGALSLAPPEIYSSTVNLTEPAEFLMQLELDNLTPVDHVSIEFDSSDSLLFPIIFDGSSDSMEQTGSLFHVGIVRCPQTDQVRYIKLPVNLRVDVPIISDSEFNLQVDVPIISDSELDNLQPPPLNPFQVPLDPTLVPLTPRNIPTSYFDGLPRRKITLSKSMQYGLKKCDYAQTRFEAAMSAVSTPAVVHKSFEAQKMLKAKVFAYSNSSNLNEEHLRGFEVNFDAFFDLVAHCPQKYSAPALALALQYDQDFDKFLTLFYKIPNSSNFIFMEEMLLQFLLHMPMISNVATDFFLSSKNYVFFFGSITSSHNGIGKFSFSKLIHAVSDYRRESTDNTTDFSKNHIRSLLLSFDIFEYAKTFIFTNPTFAVESFLDITKCECAFKSEEEYHLACYSLLVCLKSGSSLGEHIIRNLSGLAKPIVKLALQMKDIPMLEFFFKHFELESKNELVCIRSNHSTQHTKVRVRHISPTSKYLIIEIFNDNTRNTISLILPVN